MFIPGYAACIGTYFSSIVIPSQLGLGKALGTPEKYIPVSTCANTSSATSSGVLSDIASCCPANA